MSDINQPDTGSIPSDVESPKGSIAVPDSAGFQNNPLVGSIADWASILGLLISLFTAYKVLSLSKHYLFAGRVADYKRQLSKCCSDLNTQLAGQQFDLNSIADILALCLTVLRPLKHSGPKGISTSAKKIAKKITKALQMPNSLISNEFTVITLRELRTLEGEISNHIKDRKATPMP